MLTLETEIFKSLDLSQFRLVICTREAKRHGSSSEGASVCSESVSRSPLLYLTKLTILKKSKKLCESISLCSSSFHW